ncbi:hypothetical protein M406DRAFT_336169 [Cryphonectria parasitica EP155]|uniref:Uncharacterized protein n=1 Tax=Cryphonectria parasitica (strain ATCC 38755 / EP155) TaxID=660469 RepID=A0A9P4YBW9_CRYP1|nr:uncharacterized protein M406DRAFT_336169 [Cryphonectria parasitica EP155]KAF3770503.1 hypothetical protein M406DRAFT_336169 [Cryphonectria parasitica EP155]
MERDSRRDRGQWRGCHTFQDIVCDGDRPAPSRRNGGLKMGQPYYFYYELDGSRETHDPTRPSTSTCPYMPGQTVNIMVVPTEKSNRKRRASLSSMNDNDFMTMDPNDKFLTPRPAPVLPAIPDFLGPRHRLPTTNAQGLKHKRSDRSLPLTPTPSWWSPKKLFNRKHASSSPQPSVVETPASRPSLSEEQQCAVASESTGTRSMSPESLRRFLMDEAPVSSEVQSPERLGLSIPDDIAEEDDDDFVVASAVSECGPKTILSPPPPSSNILRRLSENESTITLKAVATQDRPTLSPRSPMPSATFYQKQSHQQVEEADVPLSRFSLSSDEGSIIDDDDDDDYADADLDSPTTTDNDIPSFYHSDADDDDIDTEVSYYTFFYESQAPAA